jgi:hypothetical protein
MITPQEQRNILSGAIDEVKQKMAEMVANSDGEAQLVDGLYHMVLVDDALKSIGSRDFVRVRKAGDDGVKSLNKEFGPYAAWNTARRRYAGYLLSFYYVLQAFSDQVDGRSSSARSKVAQAIAIRECTGKLRQMAEMLAEDASENRVQLTQHMRRADECFEREDFAGAIVAADKGITLIEREQLRSPDWAGNDLAQLYAVRGKSRGMVGLQRDDKSMIRDGVTDLDKALSFPDSYYINSRFRDSVRESRDSLKSASKKCFIATAAYGTPLAPEIDILRRFRDQKLSTHPTGRLLVLVYEYVSPLLANVISGRPHLQCIVRRGFVEPIVRWLRRVP